MNSVTGAAAVVYAQHDTALQVILISTALKEELGFESTPDPLVTIRTLTDGKVAKGGRTDFRLESLYSGERYHISNAYVVPKFFDEKGTLLHAVDITTLEHFDGVEIPVAPNRECVDNLIGQSDKALLTVLEEREGKNPHEPNFVLTRLGPVTSGGRVPYGSDNFSSWKVSTE